jgi:uncharacterized protein (TIGR03437 family)
MPATPNRIASLVLLALTSPLIGQTIAVTGVLNTFSQDTRLSPGALASVYGFGLGATPSMQIPVSVGGRTAPVLATAANQVIVQIPFETPVGAASLTVGNSQPFNIAITQYAPAIGTASQTGTGLLAAAHQNGATVTAANPAATGEIISVFVTGLGPTIPPLATGAPAPVTPLANTAVKPTVSVAGRDATVPGSVASPNQVGVYQVAVVIPTGLANGSYPLIVTIGGFNSNTVTVPVGPQPTTPPPPTITGVLSATGIPGSVQTSIQSGSWVAIYGSNLSDSTTDWTGQIVNGALPTALAGVSVTINGRAAYVYFVSPGQVNVQAPDTPAGIVQAVVTNKGVSSTPATAQLQTHAPAFFHWGPSKYAIATRYPDNAFVGNPSLGAGFVGSRPGSVLILWGTGFGPTTPVAPAGMTVQGAPVTQTPATVTVGGVPATFIGAALSPGLAGVYQIAIQLPENLPPGDALVRATIAGFQTPDNVLIFIAP